MITYAENDDYNAQLYNNYANRVINQNNKIYIYIYI